LGILKVFLKLGF